MAVWAVFVAGFMVALTVGGAALAVKERKGTGTPLFFPPLPPVPSIPSLWFCFLPLPARIKKKTATQQRTCPPPHRNDISALGTTPQSHFTHPSPFTRGQRPQVETGGKRTNKRHRSAFPSVTGNFFRSGRRLVCCVCARLSLFLYKP
eukprot:TRINITY_DN10255_c0_g1_i1.p1 TRINITY_DN10255_c0_g1~~TRINITY_DN10255_c0_g1_i1.p1  ORF type:complete len:148 (+),score=3.93 TRINITY_DN10255_c0_g1_i1:75-518(+)